MQKLVTILSMFFLVFFMAGCENPESSISSVDLNANFAIQAEITKKDGTAMSSLTEEIKNNYGMSIDTLEYVVPNLNIVFNSSLIESDPAKIKASIDTKTSSSFYPTDFNLSEALPIALNVSFLNGINVVCELSDCDNFESLYQNYIESIADKSKEGLLSSLILKISGHDLVSNAIITLEMKPSSASFTCNSLIDSFTDDASSEVFSSAYFNGKIQCFGSVHFQVN